MSTETESTPQPQEQADERPKGAAKIVQPKLGFFGTVRWLWRQLTSMRTALFLLLLLAVAAVPGSVFPQTDIDATRVTSYLASHTTTGPWLQRLGMFNVYSTPWFSAIYILLLVSLIGCVLPRIRVHFRALRSPLPRVPKRLERLPASTSREFKGGPDEVVTAAREALRRKGYRVRVDEPVDGVQAIAAEGGRLRETGNLVFHSCLVLVVLAVAADHLMGWRGDVIVPVGQSFTSSAGNYNTMDLGPWVGTNDIQPFTVAINSLKVTFEKDVPTTSPQYGQPRDFIASVTSQDANQKPKNKILAVNDALDESGTSVYLLGNGYAPVITVKSPTGKVLYSQATPFLPQDNMYRSVGAVKVSAASPKQLGFYGFFLPTGELSDSQGPISTFPGLDNPLLVLGAYQGNLFPGDLPQSVYTLNTQDMTQVMSKGQPWRVAIGPGQTAKLPDGTTISMSANIPRWAGLSARYDPGKATALIASLLGLAGLIMSMTLRRRRIFLKVATSAVPAAGGEGAGDAEGTTSERRTLVTAGALAKGADPRLPVALEALLDGVDVKLGNTPTTTGRTSELR